MRNLFMLLSFAFVSAITMNATAASSSQYQCKNQGSYVCAQSLRTGQCTQSWSVKDGNAMLSCQRFLGINLGTIDRSAYYCRSTTNGVCAVSSRTGQCTQEWSRKDGGDPMFFCKRFLGIGQSAVDHSHYSCRKTTNGACAVNNYTGQCTSEWSDKETGNGMRACMSWLQH